MMFIGETAGEKVQHMSEGCICSILKYTYIHFIYMKLKITTATKGRSTKKGRSSFYIYKFLFTTVGLLN